MPKEPKEQQYQAIDDGQSVIQAKPIDLTNDLSLVEPLHGPSLVEPLHGLTIITGDTPQPTRQKFITKVYSILWVQLLVTAIFIGCCNQIQPLQNFMKSNVGMTLMWISIIGVQLEVHSFLVKLVISFNFIVLDQWKTLNADRDN